MRKVRFVVLVGVIIFVFAGCIFGGRFGSGQGELAMYIADNRDDVEAVYVTLENVSAHSSEEGWFTVNDFESEGGEKQFDLLELYFDEELLGQKTLPDGSYTQIRLIVAALEKEQSGPPHSKSYIKYSSGEEADIFIPSGTRTGLKLNHNFQIEGGGVTRLVLDFDVNDLIEAGKSEKILLTPQTIRVYDKDMTGDISGRLVDQEGEPVVEEAEVVARDENGEEVAKTVPITEEDDGRPAGSFKLRGIEPGHYTLTAGAAGYAEGTREVTVAAGEVKEDVEIVLEKQ